MPNTLVKTEIQVVSPPADLFTEPAPPVIVNVVTQRDILDNSDQFEAAWQRALIKLKAARDWFSAQAKAAKSQ